MNLSSQAQRLPGPRSRAHDDHTLPIGTTILDHDHNPSAPASASAQHFLPSGGALLLAASSQPPYPRLRDVVAASRLYDTYEQFFASASQSFRVKAYARVCIVADAFQVRAPSPARAARQED